MLPSFQLKGKTAIVTGGGRGIGRTLAVALAEAGADVIVVSRTKEDLNKTVTLIEETGRKGYGVAADLTKHDEVVRFIEEVQSAFSSVDVLINNAWNEYQDACIRGNRTGMGSDHVNEFKICFYGLTGNCKDYEG